MKNIFFLVEMEDFLKIKKDLLLVSPSPQSDFIFPISCFSVLGFLQYFNPKSIFNPLN